MAVNSRYQPPRVYEEGTWLYGAIFTAILYGIVISLYFMCARSLWDRIRSCGSSRKNWFFFIYVNFNFFLSTLNVAFNSQITQLGFINYRGYPGGPSAYEIYTSSAPLNVTFVLSNWCADALMIWRCIVVYKDCKHRLIVNGFGCLLLLATVVTGSIWIITVSQPAQSTTGWMSFTLLFPYISVGCANNILISLLTVLRLLYHRARISKVLGPGHGTFYAGFAVIIVESAAVNTICSLLYLVPYAMGSPLANAFFQMLGQVQVIAPLLIIYRVSEGRAWDANLTTNIRSSCSRVIRLSSTQPTPIDTHSGKIDIEVALQCV